MQSLLPEERTQLPTGQSRDPDLGSPTCPDSDPGPGWDADATDEGVHAGSSRGHPVLAMHRGRSLRSPAPLLRRVLLILCALAPGVLGPASGGCLSLWDPPDPAILFTPPAASRLCAPRAELAPPGVRDGPGSDRQRNEAAPTRSHPSFLDLAGALTFPWIERALFGLHLPRRSCSGARISPGRELLLGDWTDRGRLVFSPSPSGDSPGKQTGQDAVGSRARTQVYWGPPPRLPTWQRGGSGSPPPCISCFPPSPEF